jgi:hypothetical protein
MFTLGYDKTRNCLVAIYRGMYSEEIFTAYAEKFRSVIETNPCMRFVMDMRQADMIVTKIDFRKCYAVLFKAGLDETWKKAILLPVDCYAEIAGLPIVNEFKDMNLFGDIKTAVQWLTT